MTSSTQMPDPSTPAIRAVAIPSNAHELVDPALTEILTHTLALLERDELEEVRQILRALTGLDTDRPLKPFASGRALRDFDAAFATACRKNGVKDAAYVVLVPTNEPEVRDLVTGGGVGAVAWLNRTIVTSQRAEASREPAPLQSPIPT